MNSTRSAKAPEIIVVAVAAKTKLKKNSLNWINKSKKNKKVKILLQ